MSEYEFFDGLDSDPTPVDDFDAFSLDPPLYEIDLDIGLDDADEDLDLGSADLDPTDLPDLVFDASHDLIGADPDEGGWWTDLTSEHNHDGAYDEVGALDY